MRGKWLLIWATVILLAIAVGALSVLRKPATTPAGKEQVMQPAEPVGDEVALTGKIRAAHIVAVPAPVDGTLESWAVDVGHEVLEGQPLGHIQNTGLEAAREIAQFELERAQTRVTALEGAILAARLEAARAEADAGRTRSETARLEKVFARQQMLYREGATPRLVFEKADLEYKAAQEEAATSAEISRQAAGRVAKLEKDLDLSRTSINDRAVELEAAKENLESANILAPADGAILKLGVEVGGEVARTMQDLVQIAVDPALLEVVVEPEPRVIERIRPGQPALVLVPDIQSESLEGQVKQVDGTRVIIEFSSPNPAIQHGMTASVRIKLT
ncbi:MAG: efflux RND transporter periplasmic adaptor subunit [Acidobacteria bacterium]|nr:efflux RND transporter periplasmic adaptor subunit [Acidobacteriota bacterium]